MSQDPFSQNMAGCQAKKLVLSVLLSLWYWSSFSAQVMLLSSEVIVVGQRQVKRSRWVRQDISVQSGNFLPWDLRRVYTSFFMHESGFRRFESLDMWRTHFDKKISSIERALTFDSVFEIKEGRCQIKSSSTGLLLQGCKKFFCVKLLWRQH